MMRGKRALENLDADIRDHIEEETRENIERGMTPDEARRTALRKFGNIALVKEDTRAVWIPAWIEHLLQDSRYSLRLLRRNPGFSAVVILTVALGVGLNTAVFSVFNAVLLRPLPYPDSDRLLSLSTRGPGIPFKLDLVAIPDFADWREHATSFNGMAAYVTDDQTVATEEATIRAQIAGVSEDFWAISGAHPVFGRLPNPGETGVLVLSDGAFKRWFHADPGIAGRAVTVNGKQLTITGVLPPGFLFEFPISWGVEVSPREIDAYTSFSISPQARVRQTGFGGSFGGVVAKLKPGVSVDRATTELEVIRKRIAEANPAWRPNQANLEIVPVHEKVVGKARFALSVLFLAVVLVLLVACANIAGLLLARMSSRRREIAIRASLGAGQGRVLRQFLAENMIFAALGGAAGFLIARWALAIIIRLLPDAVPRLTEATVDARVLLFTAAGSIATALLFGVGPTVSVWRNDVRDALKDSARTSSPVSGGLRVRKALVAVEIALALVLLIGAGLMLKSFGRMYSHPDGLSPERILVLRIQLYGKAYSPAANQRAYADELLRRISSAPGVEAATITTPDSKAFLKVEGSLPRPDPGQPQRLYVFNVTSAGLAKVMGARLVRGRWFSDAELTSVVAINERFARQEFGSADPIGRRVYLPGPEHRVATIAAVIADMKYSKIDADPEPELYIPYRIAPELRRLTVMVKTVGDPLLAAPSIRKLASEVDKGQPAYDVMTMEEAMAKSIAPRRFNLLLFDVFSAAALLLALIGIYGLISYTVATRTHEIGVRMALGASRVDVIRMVVRQGLVLVLAGLVTGLAIALGLARVVASLLYDVTPTEPATFVAVSGVLTATAFAACLIPALKASRIEPFIALRSE